MTTTKSVTVNKTNNNPIQAYVHPDDHAQSTYEWLLGSNLLQLNTPAKESVAFLRPQTEI